MYHRYLPNGNGQFRRQSVPDREQPPQVAPREAAASANAALSALKQDAPSGGRTNAAQSRGHSPPCAAPAQKDPPAPAFHLPFLEKLLPNHDSSDLLLLAIMLLLLSEGTEDAATIVMTLAIFLFLQ